MARFSKDALGEFKGIYRDEFREELSDDEAQEMSERVVDLLRILLRPLPTGSSGDPIAPALDE